MRRVTLIRIMIVALWMGAMGWYIRYEAYPGYFSRSLAGYRDLVRDGELFNDTWMQILFRGRPIGYSHTSVETTEKNPLERYRIQNRTSLELNLMGETHVIGAESEGVLDAMQRLQRFDFSLRSRRYSIVVKGVRADERAFDVTVASDMGEHRQRVEIPDDVVIQSPMMEMRLARLNPGEHLRMRTLDPASLGVADVLIDAVGREPLIRAGVTNDSLKLKIAYQGMDLMTWVDREGHTLRQETPLGWSLFACSAEEALSPVKGGGQGADFMEASAVPVTGVWPERAAGVVRLRLSGVPVGQLSVLPGGRQAIVGATATSLTVVVRAASWDAASGATFTAADLAASAFIQRDHPAMQQRAQELVRGIAEPRAKAQAIFKWVFRNVEKNLTVSLPSALDVLKRMEGDCNEHTYLFVALARAAGLPAQVRVGLLYKDGAMYYHAWPAVYVGSWVEMDPTNGQELVGPDHLALIAGELSQQMMLMPLMGRLRVEVLPDSGGRND